MAIERVPLVFTCAGEDLVGIIELPRASSDIGVLIVTGGPQYRIGSHRQFVDMARSLAESGIPVMRFDCRGTGDSGGHPNPFYQISDDIRAAVDAFMGAARIRRVVLWGLCDAASASMIYGYRDSRVASMVLVNPWVRTDQGRAKAYVKHYYARRFFSLPFWAKLLSGGISLSRALKELGANLRQAASIRRQTARDDQGSPAHHDFVEQMRIGMASFRGPVLFLLCGNDLTAAEFTDFVESSARWKRVLSGPSVRTTGIEGADHTFSTRSWRNVVIDATRKWVLEQVSSHPAPRS